MANVVVERRDFGGPLALNGFRWSVEALRWKALGGCDTARLRVDYRGEMGQGAAGLWRLADLLRCPLKVMGAASAAWWGYISAVEIVSQGRRARVDLEAMSNRVAVSYSENAPETWANGRTWTTFGQDGDSVKVYGAKEKFFGGGVMSAEQALGYRTALVGRHGKPLMTLGSVLEAESGVGNRRKTPIYALVEARGWWHTLNWRYYADGRGREGSLGGGGSQSFGDVAAQRGLAQTFRTNEAFTTQEVWLKMAAKTPGDSVTLAVHLNATGVGPLLASATLAGSTLSNALTWTRFGLNNPINIQTGTAYWILINRSGGLSVNNYYRVTVDEQAPYSLGMAYLYDGVNYVARVPAADLAFLVVGREESLAHLARMTAAGAGGQFLAGVRVGVAAGVYGPTFRDGSQRAGDEVERLLALGSAAGRRLLAAVDERRVLHIYEQPSEDSARFVIGRDGRLRSLTGDLLRLEQAPAGQWARLLGISPAGGMVGVQERIWMEQITWDGEWRIE